MGKEVPYEKTAESWEVSTNKNGKSIIVNGIYEGKELSEIFENAKIRTEIFGTKTENMDRFPLLIKFIDANDNLSVQVHPDDKYAKEIENDIGKTEMWYIIDCSEDAQVICGMKENVKQEEVEEIIKTGKIKENLNYINVKKGDAIYIPAGTIHALLGNTLLCEVQQNSDLTYRVYDWDRVGKDGKPRELHKQKAIDVINVENKPAIISTDNVTECTNIAKSPYFKTDKIIVEEKTEQTTDGTTFYAINITKGKGELIIANKNYKIQLGDSFIIPANLGEYTITGKLELLKSYI